MRGEWNGTTARTVDLGYDQLLVLEARPGLKVRVLYGHLWLTEEGSAQDVFAGSGDEVALRGRGRAVVEGLGMARVQLIEPPPVTIATARWLRSHVLQPAASWLGRLRVAAVRRLHA